MRQSLIEGIILEDKRISYSTIEDVEYVISAILNTKSEIFWDYTGDYDITLDRSSNPDEFIQDLKSDITVELENSGYNIEQGSSLAVSSFGSEYPYISVNINEYELEDEVILYDLPDVRSDFNWNEEGEEYFQWLSDNDLEDNDDNYLEWYKSFDDYHILISVMLVE